MRKAIIKDNKVINIIETDENGIQGLIMPENQVLWDCTQYAVGIGDTFNDGVFYRETKRVDYIPSTEEEVAVLKAKLSEVEATNLDLMEVALTDKGALINE